LFMQTTVCSLSFLFFFFSSRRRHTRFSRDWSSDVCSSDLGTLPSTRATARRHTSPTKQLSTSTGRWCPCCSKEPVGTTATPPPRSEERRVGKECRSRGSAYHERKSGEEVRVAET